jgi:hypothetical protein
MWQLPVWGRSMSAVIANKSIQTLGHDHRASLRLPLDESSQIMHVPSLSCHFVLLCLSCEAERGLFTELRDLKTSALHRCDEAPQFNRSTTSNKVKTNSEPCTYIFDQEAS